MSDQSPRVSVVVPMHRVETWISGVVRSVLRSSLPLELIVVNDASPDESAALAATTIGGDPRGRVVDNHRRKGGDGARNSGLDLATAPYVVFLDGDDEIADGGLEALMAAIESNSDVSAVCGSFDSRDADGHRIVGGWESEHRAALAKSPTEVRATHLARRQLAPPPGAIIMRTDLVRSVGGWDEGDELAGLATDYELLARLAVAAPLAVLDQVVLHYCVRPSSLSRRRNHPRKFFRARVLTIQRAPRSQRLALALATASRSSRLAAERCGDWRHPRQVLRGFGNALHAVMFIAVGFMSTMSPR